MAALVRQSVPRDGGLITFLETYIPEPASLVAMGVSETSFYNTLSYYYSTDSAEFAPFDSVAATDGFVTDIVAPLQEAQALFDGATYLTRLSTFISPPEMTKDPLFLFNADLGDVSNVHTAQAVYECGASQFSHCDAPIRLTLPDGTVERLQQSGSPYECFGSGAGLPTATFNALPALATAWQRREVGTGIVVTDNTAMITQALMGTGGGPGNPPTDAGAGPPSEKTVSGCNCGVAKPGGAALAASFPMMLVALLSLRRRRR